MQYMGSKARFARELVPIIQSYINKDTKGYLEPFVGGANIIDKINANNKIGNDIHWYLISLFKHIQETIDDIPDRILFEEYDMVRKSYRNNTNEYDDWYKGLVGFCASYGNRFFDGGYARNNKEDTNGKRTESALRNLKEQADNLKDIKFICKSFLELPKDKIKGYVIYCDPPYRNTKNYSTGAFPYDDFYEWVRKMSAHNTVLVSEYSMPKDFICIWEKKTKTTIDKNAKDRDVDRVEKLFIHKSLI